MARRIKELECIKDAPNEGFVKGEKYELVSGSGKYLDMKNKEGYCHVMTDEYFRVGKK